MSLGSFPACSASSQSLRGSCKPALNQRLLSSRMCKVTEEHEAFEKLLGRWDGSSFLCYTTPEMASLGHIVTQEANCSGLRGLQHLGERQVSVLTLSVGLSPQLCESKALDTCKILPAFHLQYKLAQRTQNRQSCSGFMHQ